MNSWYVACNLFVRKHNWLYLCGGGVVILFCAPLPLVLSLVTNVNALFKSWMTTLFDWFFFWKCTFDSDLGSFCRLFVRKPNGIMTREVMFLYLSVEFIPGSRIGSSFVSDELPIPKRSLFCQKIIAFRGVEFRFNSVESLTQSPCSWEVDIFGMAFGPFWLMLFFVTVSSSMGAQIWIHCLGFTPSSFVCTGRDND